MNKLRRILLVSIVVVVLGFSGIFVLTQINKSPEVLRLATTTSVDNTGLLDALVSRYTSSTGVKVEVIAKGTGASLKLAEDGSVDAVIVHAPDLEEEFINNGFGVNRTTLWYNYFLLVGPADDPLSVANNISIAESFSRIYNSSDQTHPFISRGDGSGTHVKELQIWQSLNLSVDSSLPWYLETGSGMSSTLRTTSELGGYTISDLGTYTNFKDSLDLTPIYQREDELLYNPYSFIAVNPEKHDVEYSLALQFLQFLKDSQDFVDSYRVNNEQLFIPINS